HYDTALLRSPHVVPSRLWQLLPPGSETANLDGGNAVPIHGILILGLCCRQLLRESKNIGALTTRSFPLHFVDAAVGIFHVTFQPFLTANDVHLQPSSSDVDDLAVNLYGWDSDPHTLDVY